MVRIRENLELGFNGFKEGEGNQVLCGRERGQMGYGEIK